MAVGLVEFSSELSAVESSVDTSPVGSQRDLSTLGISSFNGNYDVLKNKFRQSAVESLKKKQNSRSIVQLGDLHFAEKKYSKALKYYKNALNLNKRSPEIFKKIIVTSIALHRVPEAKYFFEELIQLSSTSGNVYNYLNFLFINRDDLSLSDDFIESQMQKYSKQFPGNADIYNIFGLYALNYKKSSTQAKNLFMKALTINENHIHALNNLGVYHLHRRKYSEADQLFLRANEADPTYQFAYENRASMLLSRKKSSEAAVILQQAFNGGVGLNNDWKALLSQLHLDAGRWVEAKKVLENLRLSSPLNPGIINNLAVIDQNLRKFDAALQKFKAAYELSFKRVKSKKGQYELDAIVFKNYASLSYDMRRYSLAKKVSQELTGFFPLYSRGHSLFAKSLMDEHKYEDARKHLLTSLKLDSNDKEAAINLSFIYDVIDFDFNASIELLSAHIPLNNDNSNLGKNILNNYVYALIKSNKLDLASKYIEKLSDTSMYAGTKALYLLKLGQIEEALKLYQESYDKYEEAADPYIARMNRALSYYELANYWIDQGDSTRALKYIELGRGVDTHKNIKGMLNNLRFQAI